MNWEDLSPGLVGGAVGGLVGWLVYRHEEVNRDRAARGLPPLPWFSWGKTRPQPRPRPQLPPANITRPKSPWLSHGGDEQRLFALKRELDSLTRDREVSNRLLDHVQRQYPGRDLGWCLEKAIHDLERDRR